MFREIFDVLVPKLMNRLLLITKNCCNFTRFCEALEQLLKNFVEFNFFEKFTFDKIQ